MPHVRQHSAVHLFVFHPVGTVKIRNVKIVTLVAPAFVEDLFELGGGLEIHAQADINSTLAGLRRSSIGVDYEKRRRQRGSACGRARPTSRGGSRRKFAAIRTYRIISDRRSKRRRFSITDAITNQLTAGSCRTAGSLCARRFEIEDCPVGAGLQREVLTFGNARDGNDAFGQPIKIDLHVYRSSW